MLLKLQILNCNQIYPKKKKYEKYKVRIEIKMIHKNN